MTIHSNILAWKSSVDRGAWVGCSPWGCRVVHDQAHIHILLQTAVLTIVNFFSIYFLLVGG